MFVAEIQTFRSIEAKELLHELLNVADKMIDRLTYSSRHLQDEI